MQYSLRWILALTAYVALATAAFGHGAWYYGDILWVVSLLAFAFASLLACFAPGRRQVIAAGFVIGSACFLVCLHFGGAFAVPTPRLLNAAGMNESTRLVVPYGSTSTSTYTVLGSGSGAGTFRASGLQPLVTTFPIYLRAANAIGMMLFGLVGCVLGALAFRAVGANATG